MNYKCWIFSFFVFLCNPCLFGQAFLTDAAYRKQVEQDFANRESIMPADRDAVMQTEDLRTREALQFLYAYMPQSDLVDYSYNFFREQADYAFLAQRTFSWGKTIPESVFRHFVLVYRVNNEDLDTARACIFHQLKNRIRNMSMYDAALEVNHWCHEHVNYQPADARTSAPLATLRTSHGRCGEESTLTVTAMRAVGIPARQCYTPRWAHCDDNHAWVEVWVDGKWYFLGACEPEPALDMGWFAIPSTRTMMVHTNVFGKYDGPEEINATSPYFSRINLMPNYAETAKLTVKVIDTKHNPVKDAIVKFKLYNYAEYFPLAAMRTDEQGQASIITGKGDLLIWVNKGNSYQYAKMDARRQDTLTVMIDGKTRNRRCIDQFDMTPPAARPVQQNVTEEQQAVNDRRLAYEDSLREAYHRTYPDKQMLASVRNANFNSEDLIKIIGKSEGNYAEIMKFLAMHEQKRPDLLIPEFIAALSDKDLRDCRADVLEQQLVDFQNDKYPKEVFIRGILPARISNELLRPWRAPLHEALTNTLSMDNLTVAGIRELTLNQIQVDENCNYYNCPISPMGVWRGRRADSHSRNIFFVAACRSLDIPAYMDNATGELYAWENNHWNKISFAAKKADRNSCTLILNNPSNCTYWSNYTIARFKDGDFVTYDFENDERVRQNPIKLHLAPGYYLFSTGNRYPDGKVLSQLDFFQIDEKDTVEKTIALRPLTARTDYYGHISLADQKITDKTLQEMLTQSGKSRLILCFVQPGNEPTNHLMVEMSRRKHDYEAWGGKILFVLAADKWECKYDLPENLMIVQGKYESLYKAVVDGLRNKPDAPNQIPLCTVINLDGVITFFSEGYHVGLGDLLIDEVKD